MATTAVLDVPKGYELIGGELVRKADIGAQAAWALSRLFALIDEHCRRDRLGVAIGSEAPYQCFSAGTVRKPRVSVIRCDPDQFIPPTYNVLTAPELTVEIIPLNRVTTDLDKKVDDFLRAGTRLVWVIDSDQRLVFVHRADGSITEVRDPGDLTGEAVLPGFTTPLAAFLPRRPTAPQ